MGLPEFFRLGEDGSDKKCSQGLFLCDRIGIWINKKKKLLKISVRNLWSLYSGKVIWTTDGALPLDREAMLKGGRIHRKIQKQMNASYRAEVPSEMGTRSMRNLSFP